MASTDFLQVRPAVEPPRQVSITLDADLRQPAAHLRWEAGGPGRKTWRPGSQRGLSWPKLSKCWHLPPALPMPMSRGVEVPHGSRMSYKS